MATGRSPRAGLGAGRPRSLSPTPHIRTQEGVGPSAGPGPRARTREPGYLPGPRARPGPRTASPDQPRRRPRGPHGRLAGPHPAALGLRPAGPGPAQPGRSPPARGPGSDFAPGPTGRGGAGQCLEAPPAPGRAGTTASFLGWGTLPFRREAQAPPPTSLGAGMPLPSSGLGALLLC